MVNRKNSFIAGAIALASIIGFIIFHQSDKEKIKAQFTFVADTIKKQEGESPIIAAAKSKKIKEAFMPLCQISAPAYSFVRTLPVEDLPNLVLQLRALYSHISLVYRDMQIQIHDEKSAQVIVTVIVRTALSSGELIEDIHELDCRMQNTQDTWRFASIEMVEVLKK